MAWKQQIFVAHGLESGKSKVMVPSDEALVRLYFRFTEGIFWLSSHEAEGVGELSGSSFASILISFIKAPSLSPSDLPPTSHMGLQHLNLRGRVNLQTPCKPKLSKTDLEKKCQVVT